MDETEVEPELARADDSILLNLSVSEWAYRLHEIVDELSSLGVSLFDADWSSVSAELTEKCRLVHYISTVLLMSADGSDVSLVFNAENARILAAGRLSWSEFSEEIKRYDYSDKCNTVWHVDSIAYRCYTCARNPCMSLCAECFDAADHASHDYSRFFSQSGGACDCGNEDILDPIGFCRRHRASHPRADPPPQLLAMAGFVMTKVVVRLASCFRQYSTLFAHSSISSLSRPYDSTTCISEMVSGNIMLMAEELIAFLQNMLELGHPIVDLLAEILCDVQFYQVIQNSVEVEREAEVKVAEVEMLNAKEQAFRIGVFTLKPCPASRHLHLDFPAPWVRCECLLDELIFAMIRLGFPQPLINLLLSQLPNDRLKERFACRFFEWYALIDGVVGMVISDGVAEDNFELSKIASRVVHVSVQICSSKNVCVLLQEKINVLRKVLDSALRVVYTSCTNIRAHHSPDVIGCRFLARSASQDRWPVFNVSSNQFFVRYGHWYLVTDVQNLFAHREICQFLFANDDLVDRYILLLNAFQGVNVIWRVVDGDHVEADTGHLIQRYFTVEWEINATLLFSSVFRFDRSDLPNLIRFCSKLVHNLGVWFDVVGLAQGATRVPPYFSMLHLPLHRQLAAVILQHLKITGTIEPVMPTDPNLLSALLVHPLKIQATIAEYFAKMWVRNGNMVRNSVYLYSQAAFTHGFQDLDLHLMRLVSSQLDGWTVMRLMYDAFHLHDCLAFDFGREEVTPPPDQPEPPVITQRDWVYPMLDGFLKLLLELCLVRSFVEQDLRAEIRAELVHILSANQQPYSKLRQALPDRGSDFNEQVNGVFEEVLAEVAAFEQPDQGNQIQQGVYRLTEAAWYQHVDMIRARFRANSPRDFNTIQLRMEVSLRERLDRPGEERFVWPCYRVPAMGAAPGPIPTWHLLLHPAVLWPCRFVVERALASANVPLAVLQQTLFLLSLMVRFAATRTATPPFRYLTCLDYHPDLFEQPHPPPTDLTLRHLKSLFFTLFTEPAATALSQQPLLHQLVALHHQLHSHEFRDSKPDQMDKSLLRAVRQDPDAMNNMVGSGTDHVARLLSLLYHSDKSCELILEARLNTNLSSTPVLSGSQKNDFMMKKLAAKKKQMDLLNARRNTNKALLERLMKSEGMESEEMEEKEQNDGPQLDCPICNGAADGGFGLFVYIQTTSVCNDQVHESPADLAQPADTSDPLLRYSAWERAVATACGPDQAPLLMSPGELKVCGHYSHLRCFDQYKNSVHDNGLSVKHRLSVPCPVCRCNVTALLPMAIRLDDTAPPLVCVEEQLMREEGHLAATMSSILESRFEISQAAGNKERLENAVADMQPFGKKVVELNHHFEVMCTGTGGRTEYEPLLHHAVHTNPLRMCLSFVRNNVDRVALITSEGLSYPTRLRRLTTESLFVLALARAEAVAENRALLDGVWAQLLARPGHAGTPVLAHESSTLLLLSLAPAVGHPRLPKDALRALFRVCFAFALVQNACRNALLVYMRAPQRSAIRAESQVASALLGLLHGAGLAEPERAWPERAWPAAASLDECLERCLTRFTVFGLNLMIELGLLDPVADAAVAEPRTLRGLLHVVLGQAAPLDALFAAVDGARGRVSGWLAAWTARLKPPLATAELWWRPRRLQQPPHLFDTLFGQYYGRKCARCARAPLQPFICLACGALLCFDDCCDVVLDGDYNQLTEVESHSYSCSAGIGCLLSLTSTVVIIVHGGLSNMWGSIYLDNHGEEDRNLRRGKRLTLSSTRFRRLQELWTGHDFERSLSARNWLPVEHLAHVLKECHRYAS